MKGSANGVKKGFDDTTKRASTCHFAVLSPTSKNAETKVKYEKKTSQHFRCIDYIKRRKKIQVKVIMFICLAPDKADIVRGCKEK